MDIRLNRINLKSIIRKPVIIFISIFCCLSFIVSCGSKPVVKEDNKEIPVDTTYIKDSIAKAKNVLACNTPYKSVDILIIENGTTEDVNLMSFFYKMDKKGNILSGGKPFDFLPTKNLDPFTSIKTSKVSQKALYYLAGYIDRQCDCKFPFPKDDSIRFAGGYIFKLVQNGQTKTCYVFPDSMDSVIQYLKGIREWLKDSKYKREFKDLTDHIDFEIKINNEYKSPQIPWWPSS